MRRVDDVEAAAAPGHAEDAAHAARLQRGDDGLRERVRQIRTTAPAGGDTRTRRVR